MTNRSGKPPMAPAAALGADATALAQENAELRAELARLQARLAEAEGLADRDALTPLFNRRALMRELARARAATERYGGPASLVYFDLDGLKAINDRFGHSAGDEILKLFAGIVVNTLRITDLSGRIGGEEFAALLPCSLEEGVIAAERVREAFERSGIVDETGPVDTTVSIGVAGGPAGTELEVLLAAADAALYQAKRGGRNRVEAAEELPLSLENSRRKTAGIARHPQQQPGVARLA
jgi:diguanylate cyclase (GGDEF)-like protein